MSGMAENRIAAQAGGSRVSRLALLAALTSAVVGGGPAVGYACPAIINAPMAAAVGLVTGQLTAMGTAVAMMTTMVIDALTRSANQDTQSIQEHGEAASGLVDAKNTATASIAIGARRAKMAMEFVPSRTACGEASQIRNLESTTAFYQQQRTNLTRASTSYSLNKPGGPTEKGSLAAAANVFKTRCSLYANPASVDSSACAGTSDPDMVDRDIQPTKSILQNLNIETAPFQQAASDTINMLTEPVAADPVRGQALLRGEGRNIHVMRMRDVTRMNIARNALEDMVALRTSPTTAGPDGKKNSRYARYVELMTGEQVTGNLTDRFISAIDAAGQPESANVQGVAARLSSQKLMLVELLRMTDQLLAIEAVKLAQKVEATASRGITSAALPVEAK